MQVAYGIVRFLQFFVQPVKLFLQDGVLFFQTFLFLTEQLFLLFLFPFPDRNAVYQVAFIFLVLDQQGCMILDELQFGLYLVQLRSNTLQTFRVSSL